MKQENQIIYHNNKSSTGASIVQDSLSGDQQLASNKGEGDYYAITQNNKEPEQPTHSLKFS